VFRYALSFIIAILISKSWLQRSKIAIIATPIAIAGAAVLLAVATGFSNPFAPELRYPTFLQIDEDAKAGNNMAEVIELSEQEIQRYPEFYEAVMELAANNRQEDPSRARIEMTSRQVSEIKELLIQKYAEKLGSRTAAEEQLNFGLGVSFVYDGEYYKYIAEVVIGS
jgi:hypothetical protein